MLFCYYGASSRVEICTYLLVFSELLAQRPEPDGALAYAREVQHVFDARRHAGDGPPLHFQRSFNNVRPWVTRHPV